MTMLLNRHATSELAQRTRAAQRKQRLIEIENEQRLEEAEALKMTEEQRQILLRSFTSVKVEFSDLDGLAWHPPSRASSSPTPRPTPRVSAPDQAFVILTNADLASFAPNETIRASAGSRPRPRTSVSSPNLSAAASFSSSSPSLKHSYSHLSSSSSPSFPSATIKAILPGTSRSRSPIKGLFPILSSDADESDGERTVQGSDSDSDDSPRPKKERKKSRSGRGRAASGPSRRSVSGPVAGARSASIESAAASLRIAAWSAAIIGRGGGYRSSSSTYRVEGVECAEPAAAADPPSGPYPAYITYSPSPSPAPSEPSVDRPRPAKPSIFPPVSKPGSSPAVYQAVLKSA